MDDKIRRVEQLQEAFLKVKELNGIMKEIIAMLKDEDVDVPRGTGGGGDDVQGV